MSTTPRPHVVVHVAVTLDGATTGFAPAIGRFYELAGRWREDVTLTGADTILAQEAGLRAAPRTPAPAGAPLLAVVDGRGRVREWEALGAVGHWRGVLALQAATGAERVDLAAALTALTAEHGARLVRVDSGGALTGALLERGLVDEISLLVHPLLAGAGQRVWHGGAQPAAPQLHRIAAQPLEDGLVWLRYLLGGTSHREPGAATPGAGSAR
jgi:2,5-diamino-6-(ribosylamino)-4(3H)-pyrimidinone 5'-phosphate reductase